MLHIFKFNSREVGDSFTAPKSGETINGASSIMWVERYAEPGEFEISAPLGSDLKRFLPVGTIISHTGTKEVMMVENHEITENKHEESDIKITGRSLVAFLENRLVGVNLARASSTHKIVPFTMADDETYNQIVLLINQHILTATDADDQVPYVSASTAYTGAATSEARTIERGPILDSVLELLDVDDLGIRSKRSATGHDLEVYKGTDRRNKVIFSWTGDDLKSTSHLFTNKKHKTTALVVGKWIWVVVDTGSYAKYGRRMVMVDASDIDDEFESAPTSSTSPTLATIVSKMQTRGRQKIRKQREIKLTNAEVSNLSTYEYRQDYFLGDLVTLEGDFNQQETKRISEYAEVLDENGYSGHPTLASPFEEEEI